MSTKKFETGCRRLSRPFKVWQVLKRPHHCDIKGTAGGGVAAAGPDAAAPEAAAAEPGADAAAAGGDAAATKEF